MAHQERIDRSDLPWVTGALRILVVEDDLDLLTFASRVLAMAGHEVTAATDAESARSQVPDPAAIDCLFSDVVLPGTSGPELAAGFTADRPDLPVLFTTGLRDQAAHDEILATGHPLLLKPYTAESLGGALRALLETGAGGTGEAR
jgi:CheY-like chemotaxis protein